MANLIAIVVPQNLGSMANLIAIVPQNLTSLGLSSNMLLLILMLRLYLIPLTPHAQNYSKRNNITLPLTLVYLLKSK